MIKYDENCDSPRFNVEKCWQSAEMGYAKAQFNLAECYYRGKGVFQNYEQASKWYQAAVANGFTAGSMNIDYQEYDSETAIQDIRKDVDKLMKSAEEGDAHAQLLLGIAYEEGRGVLQDYGLAAHWWGKSAEQGYSDAQHNIGLCYLNGWGVEQDFDEAVKWWKQAEKNGNVYANVALDKLRSALNTV